MTSKSAQRAAMALVLTVAACSSKDDTSPRAQSPPAEAVAPPVSLGPSSRSIASSIAGNGLRKWIAATSTTAPQLAKQVPRAVLAELGALLAPVAIARPQLRWATPLRGDQGGMTIAIAYDYAGDGRDVVGFTVAADRQGVYVINQAVEISAGDLEFGETRDIDGDAIDDIVVVYNRSRGEDREGGLILLGSKSAAPLALPLTRSRAGGARTTSIWSSCWAYVDGRPALVTIVGERSPEHKKERHSAVVYAPDADGKLANTTLYAGLVGSSNSLDPLTEEWRKWIELPDARPPLASGGGGVHDPVTCPAKQHTALIVPMGATRPRGGDGYYLLAWPALERSRTIDGVKQSRLPAGSIVELGGPTPGYR